jgi:hypothetical protein
VLLCFGFYNMAPGVDLRVFAEAERRNAEAYRVGCRTFGWECLANYACVGQPPGTLPFGFAHVYVIEGDDPAEALRASEEAVEPPGFAEIVAEGREFMTSQDDTMVAWLLASGCQPAQPVPLHDRSIVVRLGLDLENAPEHAEHGGWLGRFTVAGAAVANTAEVCVHDSGDEGGADIGGGGRGGRSWLLTPVVTGRLTVPLLA